MKRIVVLAVLLALTALLSAATYFTEGFETAFSGTPPAPTGWTQTRIQPVRSLTAEYDWVQNTWTGSAWSVSSSGSNPTGAQSGTGVLWINDYNYMTSSTPMNARRMESPALNLTGATSPYLRFWYFNNQAVGLTMNFRVMVSANGGSTWDLLTPIVNGFTVTNLTWNRITLKIPDDYKTANFKFAFEITNRYGSNNPFIDNVIVEDYTPTEITSAATGDWNNTATWVGGVIPTADNGVIIASGHTVTVTSASSATGIIARCQYLVVNSGAILTYGAGTSNLMQVFGSINVFGTFRAYNGTSGRAVYVGENFYVGSTGSVDFSVGTTAQGTGTTAITTGTTGPSILVWCNNQPGEFRNNEGGTLVNNRIGNLLHMSNSSVIYNTGGTPLYCPYTVGLYLGTVYPAGNLILGNAPSSTTQVIERANGSFFMDPSWNNTNISTRSNYYYSPNWVPLTQTTLTTGGEIELLSGVRTVSGALTMNTHNNLQLAYPVTVGTSTTGSWTMTRGIIITNEANQLWTTNYVSSAVTGVAPSTATPPTTHGSYVAGPLRRTFPTSTTSRTFPLGIGTAFNGAVPNANVLKSCTLAPGTNATNQSPTVSMVGAPSGSVNAPLTSVMGPYAYRINLNGAGDFTSSATFTMTCMNYTYGNSDNLIGSVDQLRVAQATSLTGPWSERSATTGSGSFVDNTVNTRTNSTGAPGPIAPFATNGEYLCWATTAPGQTYTSCTTAQPNVSDVPSGGANQEVISIQIVTSGALAPLAAQSFDLNMFGTSDYADVTAARLYYTGTTNAFATTNQFGSAVPNPPGTFTINGSQTLQSGTNYFWLAYDISGTATVNNFIDAGCTQIMISGINRVPDVTAPAGNRQIKLIVTIPSANTNTSSSRYPFGTYYGYLRHASIYTAAELGSAANKQITDLSWYVNSLSTPGSTPAKIYLKNTPSTTHTSQTYASLIADAMLVYDNTIANTFWVAGDWNKIHLSTPFTGDGTNLMVIVETNATGTGNEGSTAKQFRHGPVVTNTVQYWEADTNMPTGNGTLTNSRPNLMINYIIPIVPIFNINPNVWNFQRVEVGTTSTPKVFTIKNVGTGMMTINPTDIGITGANADQFILNTLAATANLGPLEEATFSVAFKPTTKGAKIAILNIEDNLAKVNNMVSLSGTGFVYAQPDYFTDFEDGTWGDWTVVNGTQVNRWFVGSATAAPNGQKSAYVSNDMGATNNYTIGTEAVVHFYQDLKFPAMLEHDTFKLEYDWKGMGEGTTTLYDYLKVYLVDISVTPVAGALLTETALATHNLQNTWQHNSITLLPTYSGTYKRLVFTWRNDNSVGTMPAIAVDNIGFLRPEVSYASGVPSGGVVNLDPPAIPNPLAGGTIDTQMQIDGLGADVLVNCQVEWAPPSVTLPNAGLVFTLSGTTFGNTTITITHNLGFPPVQVAYKILPAGTYQIIPNPGTWTNTVISFFIPMKGKADGDLIIVLPDEDGDVLPVEMSSFTATLTAEYFVNLAWVVQSETNHMGYNVLRSYDRVLNNAITVNPAIISGGTQNGSEIRYNFTDKEVEMNTQYYYWLENISLGGVAEYYGPITVTVGVNPEDPAPPVIPVRTALLDAYPNPFNPMTSIHFIMKEGGTAKIDVFNLKGQLIRSFDKTVVRGGHYSVIWDGKDMNGKSVGSGIYLYRMQAGKYTASKKMMLTK